jgi:uracil-DNA glycosylase family 4
MPQITLLHNVGGKIRQDMRCTSCELCEDPRLMTNCMPGVGNFEADLMFFGYAPASEDDSIGRPMTGRGGRIFREILIESGIDPKDVYISNVLKCCPFDKKPKLKYFEKCKQHFFSEIKRVKPKAIVTLGAVAFNWLTGQKGVRKFRQNGIPCQLNPSIIVYPIQQPASIFYTQDQKKKEEVRQELLDDLRYIHNKLREGTLWETGEVKTDYKYAKTMSDVYGFMKEIDEAPIISVDLECGTVDGQGALFPEEGTFPVAFGFSTGPYHGRAIPLYAWSSLTDWYWTDDELKIVMELIKERLKRKKVFGQNWLQYDQKWIKCFFGLDRTNVVFDTQLAHYLVDEERGTHDLEQLAVRYTKMPVWKSSFTLRDIHETCNYLCKDVDATFRIKEPIEKEMTDKQKHLHQDLHIPLAHELMEMEYRGIRVDLDEINKLSDYLGSEIDRVMKEVRSMPEVKAFELEENVELNMNRWKDLAIIMEKYLKLPSIARTATGSYSTSKETLLALQHIPFVQKVTQIRGLVKLNGTYVNGIRRQLKSGNRVHTSFLIHGTATNRLSSRDPNLQNIPREDTVEKVIEDGNALKSVFLPDDGYIFLNMDYSQAELRTLAMYSKDPGLIEIFRKGLDAHQATASKVYAKPIDQVKKGERSFAKTVNFGVIYGMSEESLIYKFVTSGASEADAREFMRLHKEEFHLVYEWMDRQEHDIRMFGFQETFFGTRRRYEEITRHSIRQAYNFPIQATASLLLLYALIRIAKMLRKLGLDAFISLTVHDSILLQVRPDQLWDTVRVVKHIAENLNFPFMNVPMKADFEVGRNWGRMHKINIEKEEILI